MKAMEVLERAYNAENIDEMLDIFIEMCSTDVGAQSDDVLFEAGTYDLPPVPEWRQGDIPECATAAELVTRFMEMEEEEGDEELLFSLRPNLFCVSLTRQFPDVEDEFFQIHLDLMFPATAESKAVNAQLWRSEAGEKFFEAVRRSSVWQMAREMELETIQAYIDIT